jgi:hypothetical protein
MEKASMLAEPQRPSWIRLFQDPVLIHGAAHWPAVWKATVTMIVMVARSRCSLILAGVTIHVVLVLMTRQVHTRYAVRLPDVRECRAMVKGRRRGWRQFVRRGET